MNQEGKFVYLIKVQGRLHDRWSDWFNGMTITSETAGDGSIITTLTCEVIDQSALHGILEEILNLNLPLISLIRIGSAECQSHSVQGVEANG